MIQLHPEFLHKDGRPQFVVLPFEEYEELQQVLADAQDLIDLREAKASEGAATGFSLEEVRRNLGSS